MAPGRGQSSLEYLLLLMGVLVAVIVVFIISQSLLFGPSGGMALNQTAGSFFGFFQNTTLVYGARCWLTSLPSSLGPEGGTSNITAYYTGLAPAGGNVALFCGNGNASIATGCAAVTNQSTTSCSTNCTYAAGVETYRVTARVAGVTCTSSAVAVTAPGTTGAQSASYQLSLPVFSGLDANASSTSYQLQYAFIPFQPGGSAGSAHYSLSAGPIYTR